MESEDRDGLLVRYLKEKKWDGFLDTYISRYLSRSDRKIYPETRRKPQNDASGFCFAVS